MGRLRSHLCRAVEQAGKMMKGRRESVYLEVWCAQFWALHH